MSKVLRSVPRYGIEADSGEEQARKRGNEPFDEMPGRQRGHHGKAEHGHREIFGSAEGHGRPGQHWSDENQSQSTDDAADEGGYGSHVQSPAGFSAGREGGAFRVMVAAADTVPGVPTRMAVMQPP